MANAVELIGFSGKAPRSDRRRSNDVFVMRSRMMMIIRGVTGDGRASWAALFSEPISFVCHVVGQCPRDHRTTP